MKAILSKPVAGVGEAGDVVEVSPGYFRNFLVPRRLAAEATDKNLAVVSRVKQQEERAAVREQREAEQLAAKLAELPIRVAIKAGEHDRLFGSVTASDIADKLHEAGYDFDRRKIVLDEPIKRLGLYTVHVRVHPAVEAKIKVLVEKA
jgi:large subunit ribosomal protein L9